MSSYDYKKGNNLRTTKIDDFRVWKLNQNMANENITERAIKNQAKIKNWAEVLNEDYKNNKNINYKYNIKTNKTKKGYTLKNYLSPNVNRIVTEVGKLITEMKNSEENLSKINIKSLLNTKHQIQKLEKLDEPSSILKIKEKEYQNSLDGKMKKAPNYKYLSDNYRKQLNRAFLNFHPIRHLGNIHTSIRENPETDKEFKEYTKVINDEIYNLTNPNFYKNQYKKLRKKFSDQKEKENLEKDDNDASWEKEKNSIKKKISLPKIANRTTMGFHPIKKYYTTEGEFSNDIKINKKFNLYQFDKKYNKRKQSENIKKFPDKEGRKLELELMEDACKNIINSINYFDEGENNFYYKYPKLNIDERKKEQSNILKYNSNVEKILLQIKNNNMLKYIKSDMDIKRKKVNDDIKDYGKKINNIKDEIIKDIEEHESKDNNFII